MCKTCQPSDGMSCSSRPSRSFHARQQSAAGTTHSFVLRDSFCHPTQLVVVRPVHPAKLGYAIAHLQPCRVCWTASDDAVDLRERCLECGGSRATYRGSSSCGGGALCLDLGVVLVKADLDAGHETFVVILQPYYTRPRCSNCAASVAASHMQGRSYSGRRRCHCAGSRRRWSGSCSCGPHATAVSREIY